MARLLTVAQAAEQIQVSEKTIRRRIKDGSIKATVLSPKIIRIAETELERYISENTK